MRHIAQSSGSELKWVQPRALRMEYELRSGKELVATLRFRSSGDSLATAKSADGCWTFKRVGFWQNRTTVRSCVSEAEIALFRKDTWKAGGRLEMQDGRKLPVSTNFCETRYEIRSESGEPLIRYRTRGVLRLGARMEILPGAELPELPWMSMLGWYLGVMMHNDASFVAVLD